VGSVAGEQAASVAAARSVNMPASLNEFSAMVSPWNFDFIGI
jgi:hypothetical protein